MANHFLANSCMIHVCLCVSKQLGPVMASALIAAL